jgi:hypothetical protein
MSRKDNRNPLELGSKCIMYRKNEEKQKQHSNNLRTLAIERSQAVVLGNWQCKERTLTQRGEEENIIFTSLLKFELVAYCITCKTLLSPNSEEWSDRSSENSRVLTQEFAF